MRNVDKEEQEQESVRRISMSGHLSREPLQPHCFTSLFPLIMTFKKYPNDSNIARANYYFLGPEVRELFEI